MIHLISGESNQIIKERINDIIVDCLNVLYTDFNNSSIDEILSEASYYSMFNDKKTIIVKNANFFGSDKISEDNSKKLLNYFENPNPLTILIFTTNLKLDSKKRIVKSIKEKYNLINISPLKQYELLAKMRETFNFNGYQIDDESLNYIASNNSNNYDLIYNEIEKLLLFYNKSCKVLYNDVVNIVSKSLDTNNFKFVDKVVAKDIKEAFKLYDDLKLTKTEPLLLIGLLAREHRLMLVSKTLRQAHYSMYDICSELGLQDWQVDKFLKNGARYPVFELENKLIYLANLDFDIKTGKIEKWNGLAKLIVDFAE